ncbi:MAG: peptidoglycan-binding protein [Candidatus Gracilibacteria bacterium]|jgi:3D (Asp-Asp-Asp) domain-containing protein
MKIKNVLKQVVTDILFILLVVFVTMGESHNGAFAEEGVNPYTQTFVITSYYSPLPCQERYVTGSYEGDIRLNGHGVHGADGTDVYPGMVAAPKTYDFGTKMYIPEIGIVAVHDRGGAIVTAGEKNQNFDRLDIWMGYGDIGLKRALAWGKQTVDVTVYGVTDSVVEDVNIPGYVQEESIPNECDLPDDNAIITQDTPNNGAEVAYVFTPSVKSYSEFDAKLAADISPEFKEELDTYLTSGLGFGDDGMEVMRLQEELTRLSFYKVEKSGVYDELTVHAVYKFQQARGIVVDETDKGAGYFGPKTRTAMNKIIGARNYTKALIAQTTKGKTEEIVVMQ